MVQAAAASIAHLIVNANFARNGHRRDIGERRHHLQKEAARASPRGTPDGRWRPCRRAPAV